MENKEDFLTIDLKALFRIIWKEKWWIFGITVLFAILGGIYSFSLKEEFRSEGKILPEIQGKGGSMGQFAGLAALAGVDLGSAGGGSDAIRPDLYPDVIKSTPFFLSLLDASFINKEGKKEKFLSFYNREVLDGELKEKDQIQKYPNSNDYISLNLQTEKNLKDLRERIVCSYDKKTGVINFNVKMPDPVVAAEVTRFGMDYLTKYIIEYRTEKQRKDLDFLEERLASARGKYYSNQSKKATYTDQMPLNALRLQSADLQRERIESEYKISSSFYNTLLQKYEEAKLKLQQDTPVIKVLEPPVVANKKSEPSKVKIIVVYLILGIFLSFIFALLKNIRSFKLFNWNNI